MMGSGRQATVIDNDVYNREADAWRDERHFLSLLVPLTPPRVAYFRDVLVEKLGIDPARKQVLDVGCGGGLMAEEVARLGCRVTGVDPSAPSVDTARAHAAAEGLDIDYRVAPGESLPFPDASFDLVYCFDVLEHVNDLDRVIGESARVVKPGGIYIYDTVNRTLMSKLFAIMLAQDWSWTSIFPRNFHVWEKFIKPDELLEILTRHDLESCEMVGLDLRANPLTLLRLVRKLKRGQITYRVLGDYMAGSLKPGKNVQISYLGYAIKRGPPFSECAAAPKNMT
jgi:2-polyprenyl-6-hydroxyphenyl methylase/3-demethylubiquinone-9 3-methyltransferase